MFGQLDARTSCCPPSSRVWGASGAGRVDANVIGTKEVGANEVGAGKVGAINVVTGAASDVSAATSSPA